MDVSEELRKLERTGEIVIGSNEAADATQSGESKLTILSATCPRDVENKVREIAKEEGIPVYYYPKGSKDLGLDLGKPFLVSTVAIIDPGDSRVLELGEVPNEN